MVVYQLGAEEVVAARPFTHLRAGQEDLALMQEMHHILCQYVQSLLVANITDTHVYRQFEDENKAVHRLVLPNWPQVTIHAPLTAVGFFGQARPDMDHSPILDLENELIARMPGTPGLFTYYNLHWPEHGWGNLVLFGDEPAKNNWGTNDLHRQAVHLSPHHYHSIRLHNGRLCHGLFGSQQIVLTVTKYLDFHTTPTWRAERHLHL